VEVQISNCYPILVLKIQNTYQKYLFSVESEAMYLFSDLGDNIQITSRDPGASCAVKRGPMSEHKFKVGQLVEYDPGPLGVAASARPYKILRLLPAEDGELRYRIKSISETFERIAKERDLVRR
jgi:hypothetical protein